jgi:hypothetical protein
LIFQRHLPWSPWHSTGETNVTVGRGLRARIGLPEDCSGLIFCPIRTDFCHLLLEPPGEHAGAARPTFSNGF